MATRTHRTRPRRVALWALACATALVLFLATSARGTVGIPGPPVVPPSTSPVTSLPPLTAANPVVNFNGPVLNPTPLPLVNSPDPAVCGPGCQEYHLGVQTTLPFLVAVEGTVAGANGSFNPNDGFDLYVYDPSGALVGSQNGIGSNGESIAIPKAVIGTYTIVVTFSYAEDQGTSYRGQVRMMSGPSWQPAQCTAETVGGVTGCFELPQLQVLPPYDIAVSGLPPIASTPVGFPLPNAVPTPTSCYVDETVPVGDPSVGGIQNPTTRCLRFTSDVRNVGGGPLEIRIPLVKSGSSGVTAAYLPGECNAEQVLTSQSGAQVTRPAGACLFHDQHLHFHYSDLLGYSLYSVNPDGTVGSKIGTSTKASFCLTDDDYFGYGSAAPNGPRDFTGQPGCNAPADPATGDPFIDEGIQPGWGDVYTWDTPGQYIDITSTPPGTYDLIEQTNPTGAVLVAGPPQTCAMTTLKLGASDVQVVSFTSPVTCPSS